LVRAADLIEKYPAFFWENVYVGDALGYLSTATSSPSSTRGAGWGRMWWGEWGQSRFTPIPRISPAPFHRDFQ
jgi:hypothetical protein